MATELDLEFARRYRTRAEDLFAGEVLEVRVFGSRARGDARPDSDLDLFVLTRGEDPKVRAELMEMAWDVACEMDLPYLPTPHVMSRAHFERMRSLEMRLARDILEEGRAV
jgi:predicted nucleotidyltransferase